MSVTCPITQTCTSTNAAPDRLCPLPFALLPLAVLVKMQFAKQIASKLGFLPGGSRSASSAGDDAPAGAAVARQRQGSRRQLSADGGFVGNGQGKKMCIRPPTPFIGCERTAAVHGEEETEGGGHMMDVSSDDDDQGEGEAAAHQQPQACSPTSTADLATAAALRLARPLLKGISSSSQVRQLACS